jgi:hypothetical protein
MHLRAGIEQVVDLGQFMDVSTGRLKLWLRNLNQLIFMQTKKTAQRAVFLVCW